MTTFENRSHELPDNWWAYQSTCEILAGWFQKHLVGLLISISKNEKAHNNLVFTGFLLFYRERLLWITAGHVIDKIQEVLQEPNYDIVTMQWLDGGKIPGAESVIVHNRDLQFFSTYENDVDFGCVMIEGLDAANILQNNEVKVVTEQIWKNIHLSNPEGYYIVGYPEEWVETDLESSSNNIMINKLFARVACLPVEKTDHPGKSVDPFWNNPEAFYGKILDYSDQNQPNSISGMSGGPLLSIERDQNGELRYYLFGLQHGWDKNKRIIRAESIQTILQIIS
ncbi:MAG: hypothetical protein H6652_06655 [Ardenticatenaceae bacterium]|nr:hypothetical protein [Ardenticatenaceae bacterium]